MIQNSQSQSQSQFQSNPNNTSNFTSIAPPPSFTVEPQSQPQPAPQSSLMQQQKTPILTAEQQQLLENFMSQPFQFVPPPLFLDESLRRYRDDVEKLIQPLTDNYQMFNQKYSIRTGQLAKQGDPSTQVQQKSQPSRRNLSLKIKVFNLKFIGYTLYATMVETLKNLKKEDLTQQKIKSSQSLLRKKIEQFYKQANQLKEDYRRIQVMGMLEREIQMLGRETRKIRGVLGQMERYVEEEVNGSRMIPE